MLFRTENILSNKFSMIDIEIIWFALISMFREYSGLIIVPVEFLLVNKNKE